MTDEIHNIEQLYNEFPYESFAFKESRPQHLFTLGTLFGLKPVPVENSKVLELACASGGNIIPMAFHSPSTQFLGLDLSKAEIEQGLQQITELNLKNITLRHQSINDFHEPNFKFDYIICHGIYSWVDNDTRHKILQICHDNLSENGIAYISYNTYPGWTIGNIVRDLLQYSLQTSNDPLSNVKVARSMLAFVYSGLADDASPYACLLRKEIELISHHSDSQFIHEHLATHNHALYFHQFMAQAKSHQLTFLGEAFLSTMYTDDLPLEFSQEFNNKDIISQGQYLDFIKNRRFRSTLLCHEGHKIKHSIDLLQLNQFYLQSNNEHEFIQFDELQKKELISAILQDSVNISSYPSDYCSEIPRFPAACPLARYQAQRQEFVTNRRHENIQLTPIMQILLPYLDGENDIESLIDIVGHYVSDNILVIVDKNNQPIVEEKARQQYIENITKDGLERLAKRALLLG